LSDAAVKNRKQRRRSQINIEEFAINNGMIFIIVTQKYNSPGFVSTDFYTSGNPPEIPVAAGAR